MVVKRGLESVQICCYRQILIVDPKLALVDTFGLERVPSEDCRQRIFSFVSFCQVGQPNYKDLDGIFTSQRDRQRK